MFSSLLWVALLPAGGGKSSRMMHFHCFSTAQPVTTRFLLWMGPVLCPRQEQAFIVFCGQTRMFPSWISSQLYPKKHFLSCCFFRAFGDENKVGNPAYQTRCLFSDLRLVFFPAWVTAAGVAQFCLPSPLLSQWQGGWLCSGNANAVPQDVAFVWAFFCVLTFVNVLIL